MTDDGELAALAADVDAIAERLADHALSLLRTALDAQDDEAARTEKLVTRARRSLEKAAALLRSAG